MKNFFIGFVLLCFCVAASGNEKSRDLKLYIPETEEIQYFLSYYEFLKSLEDGLTELSCEDFEKIYSIHVERNYFSSMIFRHFFLNTKNPEIKKKLKDCITKNGISDSYAKTLLKKIDAVESVSEQNGKKSVRYSYKNSEFDENIDLFNFTEVRPFGDEFGLLLFQNDWDTFSYENQDGSKNTKNIFLMCGGGTNSLTLHFTETEDIAGDDDLEKAISTKQLEEKYPGSWQLIELYGEGVIPYTGADKYFLGYGIGSDIVPETDCATINAYLYSKERKKLYTASFFMNFSKTNINYEIRGQIYDYIGFFALLCFCE